MDRSAIGFRVKSGWAMAVLVSGPLSAPKVLDRRRVQLADPSVPESSQPFHEGLDLPQAEGTKVVGRLVKCVKKFSARELSKSIKEYRANGYRIVGAGIVAGSTVDPKTIKNDHIRAHAEEGRLFRRVIEDAMKLSKLRVSVTAEKNLYSKAAGVIGSPEEKLKAELTAMGKRVEGPWRSEEKTATLAAWMMLAR